MWSSTLPTGTVSDEPTARTYPNDVPSGSDADEDVDFRTRDELEQAARERDRLQERCDRLQRRLAGIENELQRERDRNQQLLEQYEFKLAEERRKRTENDGRFERIGARAGRSIDQLRHTIDRVVPAIVYRLARRV